MLVKMLKHIHKIKGEGPFEVGEEYQVDDNLGNWMIDKNMAVMVAAGPEKPPEVENLAEEGGASEVKIEINPDLASWLQDHGFVRQPDGLSYSRSDKEDGKIIKLVVDFKHNKGGNRYGYILDEESGGWKDDKTVRDCQLLRDYKQFRDALRIKYALPEEVRPNVAPKEGNREIVTGKENQEAILLMEAKDNDQILAEMRGDFTSEVLKEYFYQFQSGGRTVTGLSYRGVREVARRMGHIEVKDLKIKETEKAWIVECKAHDKARDFEVYGAASQPKQMQFRSGGGRPDEFALTKAVSKAQRNALRGLIPESIVTKTYKEWRKRRVGM